MHNEIEKKKVHYISDEIGEEYKEWKNGDYVFIKSQTGSGKSYFVMHILLDYAVKNGKKILYLANRKALTGQLQKEVNSLDYKSILSISIMSYQAFEQEMKSNTSAWNYYKRFDYVVCDECHYFLNDSNFNNNTYMGFRWAMDDCGNQIKVFISATMRRIEKYIRQNFIHRESRTSFYQVDVSEGKKTNFVNEPKTWVYGDNKPSYDFIDIHIVENKEHLFTILESHINKKWLIFVDNKDFGEEIEDYLNKKSESALFISAENRSQMEQKEEIRSIVSTEKQKVRFLITTSILDNGISLNDSSIENVFICADEEEEFLQMLGRRRTQTERFNLYIYRYDMQHFQKRKKNLVSARTIALEYRRELEEWLSKGKKEQSIFNELPLWEKIEMSYQMPRYNQLESLFWQYKSVEITHKLSNGEYRLDDLRKSFFANWGFWLQNPLAFENIEYLYLYYSDIVNEFKANKGKADEEYTYIRHQLEWLGKSKEEQDEIIFRSKEDSVKESRREIEKYIEDRFKESGEKSVYPIGNRSDCIKFVEDTRKDFEVLMILADKSDPRYKTVSQAFSRRNALSPTICGVINKYMGLSFEFGKDGNSKYIIKRRNIESSDETKISKKNTSKKSKKGKKEQEP